MQTLLPAHKDKNEGVPSNKQ